MTIIAPPLLTGLAAFFVHYVFATMQPPFLPSPPTRYPRLHKFLTCPWCAGGWLAILFSVTLSLSVTHPPPILLLMQALASAATIGIISSLIPDDGEPLP